MASVLSRRPVPALIALVALIVLAGLVWWRVINRDSTTATTSQHPNCSTSGSPSGSASPSGSSKPSPSPKPPTVLPQPKNVTVEVLNSTDKTGIAGKAQQKLIKLGFNSPDPAGNDDKHAGKIKGVAQIRYPGPDAKGAELLRYYFPHAKLERLTTNAKQIVVSLGDKYKHVADPKAVAKALKADNVVIAGSQKNTKPKHDNGCSTPTTSATTTSST